MPNTTIREQGTRRSDEEPPSTRSPLEYHTPEIGNKLHYERCRGYNNIKDLKLMSSP